MLLDYKGREAGQSFTFTICRLEKNKNKKGGKQMGARKKTTATDNTHMNAHLLINTLKKPHIDSS